MKASADEKLKKIKLGMDLLVESQIILKQKPKKRILMKTMETMHRQPNVNIRTLCQLQQLQEDARENIKASATEKLKKINTEGEGEFS